MKRFNIPPVVALIAFVASVLVGIAAQADTVYLAAKPGAEIKVSEATKLLGEGKTAWKCERVKSGPNINPVKVPGSSASWHTAVGQGLDNPFQRLAAGESTYRCAEMEANMENGRVRKVK